MSSQQLCPHCGASREGMPSIQPCWRCKRLPDGVAESTSQPKRETGAYPISEAQPYVPPPEPDSTAEMMTIPQDGEIPRWLALAGILGIILFFGMILGGVYLFLTADGGNELEEVESNTRPPTATIATFSTLDGDIVASGQNNNGTETPSAESNPTTVNNFDGVTEISLPPATPLIAIGPFAETAIAMEQSATPSVTSTLLPSPSPAPTITPPDFTPATFTPIPIECSGAPTTRLALNRQIEVVSRQTVRVRETPNLQGELVLNISRGEVVTTVDGPVCSDGFIWWQIQLEDGTLGWIAEGSSSQYFVEPR